MEKNSIRWEILLKGARGTLSPEEEIIFQKWLARDIRHKAYYEKMCRVWSSDNTTYDLRKARHRKILRNIYRSVACLLILLTVGGGLMLLKKDKQEIEPQTGLPDLSYRARGKPLFFYRTAKK